MKPHKASMYGWEQNQGFVRCQSDKNNTMQNIAASCSSFGQVQAHQAGYTAHRYNEVLSTQRTILIMIRQNVVEKWLISCFCDFTVSQFWDWNNGWVVLKEFLIAVYHIKLIATILVPHDLSGHTANHLKERDIHHLCIMTAWS